MLFPPPLGAAANRDLLAQSRRRTPPVFCGSKLASSTRK